jgi:hypothetical protein
LQIGQGSFSVSVWQMHVPNHPGDGGRQLPGVGRAGLEHVERQALGGLLADAGELGQLLYQPGDGVGDGHGAVVSSQLTADG